MAASRKKESRENKENLRNGLVGVAISAVALLALYAFIVTTQYQSYLQDHSRIAIINPPIKFYVDNLQPTAVRAIAVLVNQTFCPENQVTQIQAGALTRIPYFVRLNASQVFNYSLNYNPDNFTFTDAYVAPPFMINYRLNHIMNVSHCAGYPDATANFTVSIEAPNSSYVGPIYLLLYGKKK